MESAQGQIRVSNSAALAALLREETVDRIDPTPSMDQRHSHRMEPPVRRVYIDTPMSNNSDDKYQFVSTDIEESQDYQEDDTPKLAGGGAVEPASGRYEDRSTHRPQSGSSKRSPVVQPQVQYVVKAKPSSSHLYNNDMRNNESFTLHPEPSDDEPRIIEPIRSPLLPHSRSDLEEQRALQEEAAYQQQMREKLWQQSQETEQIHIPRLPLERLDDEDKPKRDLHPLHDSLEDEYLVGDSLEVRQARSLISAAKQQQATYANAGQHSHHVVPAYSGTMARDSLDAGHNQPYHRDSLDAGNNQSYHRDSLDAGNLQPYHRDSLDGPGYNQVPRYYDPNDPANHSDYAHAPKIHNVQINGPVAHGYTEHAEYTEEGYRERGYHGYSEVQQQGYPGDAVPQGYNPPQQYFPNQQQIHDGYHEGHSGYHQDHPGHDPGQIGYQQEHGGYHENLPDQYDQYSHIPQGYHQSSQQGSSAPQGYDFNQQGHDHADPENEQYHVEKAESQDSLQKPSLHSDSFLNPHAPIIREVKPPPLKPKHDFLARNKQVLTDNKQRRKTYGQIHTSKKSSKENVTPASPTNRHKNTGKSSAGKPPQSSTTSEPRQGALSSEQLWAKRSERLENQKQVKLSSKQGGRDLRKFSSESRVDKMRDSAASTKSSPAGPYQARGVHHLQPMQQKPSPHMSLAEPIRSEVVSMSDTVPNQPIKHTIVTEDGQRLSVDINLKVISPTPNRAAHPAPVAPSSVWQQNPAAFRPHISTHAPQMAAPVPMYDVPVNNYSEVDSYDDQMYGSPRVSLTPGTSSSSVYRVLPPIGSADSEQGRDEKAVILGHSPPREAGMGGYAAQYKQQKNKKPEYKEYTLDDYRKLKKEIRLGGLGPEMDNETTREKREKRLRQVEYAKKLKSRPPGAGASVKPSSSALYQNQVNEEDDMIHKRRVALEYAKSVPKPKVRSKMNIASKPPGGEGDSADQTQREAELEIIDLNKLQQRHEQERRQVALIRQNMQHVSQA